MKTLFQFSDQEIKDMDRNTVLETPLCHHDTFKDVLDDAMKGIMANYDTHEGCVISLYSRAVVYVAVAEVILGVKVAGLEKMMRGEMPPVEDVQKTFDNMESILRCASTHFPEYMLDMFAEDALNKVTESEINERK